MNITETAAVLAKIQSYDNRNVDTAAIVSWHEQLEPHAYKDCIAAVVAHFGKSTDWILPAHIKQRVKEVELRRMQGFPGGLRLNRADEDAAIEHGTYTELLKRLGRAAATGELTHATHASYIASTNTLDSVLAAIAANNQPAELTKARAQ